MKVSQLNRHETNLQSGWLLATTWASLRWQGYPAVWRFIALDEDFGWEVKQSSRLFRWCFQSFVSDKLSSSSFENLSLWNNKLLFSKYFHFVSICLTSVRGNSSRFVRKPEVKRLKNISGIAFGDLPELFVCFKATSRSGFSFNFKFNGWRESRGD